MKVFGCGVDNVILDLEDAVAKAEKAATRALVVEALKRERTLDTAGVSKEAKQSFSGRRPTSPPPTLRAGPRPLPR